MCPNGISRKNQIFEINLYICTRVVRYSSVFMYIHTHPCNDHCVPHSVGMHRASTSVNNVKKNYTNINNKKQKQFRCPSENNFVSPKVNLVRDVVFSKLIMS